MSGLTAEKVSFSYGGRRILENVSFSAEQGQLCVLLGANGAGKSTMVKCINGLLKPGEGKIFWKETDVSACSLREKARIFGYVPQSTQAGEGLTVMETVLSGRLPHMNSGRLGPAGESRQDVEQAAGLLEEFGLEEFAFRPMGTLSGGEKQRVLIARAVAQEPQVLLLDEPTSSLDLRYQLELMELLKRLGGERNITVVAVIHDLNLALSYADKAVILKKGRVLSQGSPTEAVTSEVIRQAYGIKAELVTVRGQNLVLPVQQGR